MTKHDVLKKTYQVHYTGCPFISICIIPKMLYLRYFYKTTKDIVIYCVIPGRGVFKDEKEKKGKMS